MIALSGACLIHHGYWSVRLVGLSVSQLVTLFFFGVFGSCFAALPFAMWLTFFSNVTNDFVATAVVVLC